MKSAPRLITLRLILVSFLVLGSKATLNLYYHIQNLGVIFSPISQMWQLLFVMVVACLMILIALLLSWTRQRRQILSLGSRIIQFLPSAKPVVLILLITLNLGFSFLWLYSWQVNFELRIFHGLVIGILMTLSLLLMRRLLPNSNWLNILAVTSLMVATVYRLCQFLPDISVYPFSLGWSEASRYYYASLFFSEKIYGQDIAPSTLHPTRYLLQSVPFIINGLPLWFHRFWQVLLWLAGLFGTAFLLARRLKIPKRFWFWIFSMWVFLFLWQGPVYYHLLVMVMIVVWGFDRQHFLRSLLIVTIASIWAGMSRVNWFPVPGMLAATLYFLEQPLESVPKADNRDQDISRSHSFQTIVRYLFQPLIYIAYGFFVALGSQSAYILWSGNDPEQFTSSFSSALLWYRLLPNSTYSLGILTAVFLISLPILILIIYCYRKRYVDLHPFGFLGICANIGILLIGGLVVSVKIGGGSNLHNLDAYIAMLMIVGSYFYFHRIPMETPIQVEKPLIPAGINLALVAIPILFSLSSASRFIQYDPITTADLIADIQQKIESTSDDGGEILFITERHLLTFGNITDVTLVPEYEKVFLMEMVMSGNDRYLTAFQDDLRSQRFDVIITEPLFENYKDRGESWAEENNVWVHAVSVQILCNYKRLATIPEVSVQIYVPRETQVDCNTTLESK
ncbi:MAG: hypothetical protein ACK2U1_02790 [Anaerolineales bacterium]